MKNRKYRILSLCLVLMLALTACGGDNGGYGKLFKQAEEAKLYVGNLTSGFVGDTLSNSFFEWTVNSVRTEKEIYGKTAEDGMKFVIVDISVTNSIDMEYEIGNYDFVAYVEPDMENGMLDSMDSFSENMYPDQEILEPGGKRSGELIFEVDESVDELLLDYIEFYEDAATGNTNWFDLFL